MIGLGPRCVSSDPTQVFLINQRSSQRVSLEQRRAVEESSCTQTSKWYLLAVIESLCSQLYLVKEGKNTGAHSVLLWLSVFHLVTLASSISSHTSWWSGTPCHTYNHLHNTANTKACFKRRHYIVENRHDTQYLCWLLSHNWATNTEPHNSLQLLMACRSYPSPHSFSFCQHGW